MSSSVHGENFKKDISILAKGPTDILDNVRVIAEKEYSTNFAEHNTKFCFSLHYNGANSYVFVKVTEIHKFKTKDSEIKPTPLYIGNVSWDVLVDNLKNIGFHGYVYDFSVDYDAYAVNDILDTHKCLMKKNGIWAKQ